jgi:hypothetical protein
MKLCSDWSGARMHRCWVPGCILRSEAISPVRF